MPVSRVLPPHGLALASVPVALAGLVTQAAAASDSGDAAPDAGAIQLKNPNDSGLVDATVDGSLLTVAAATGTTGADGFIGGEIDLDTITFDGLQSVMDSLAPNDCPSKARVGCRWRVLSLVRSAPASSLNADGSPDPSNVKPARQSVPSPDRTLRATLDQRKTQASTSMTMVSAPASGVRFSEPVRLSLTEDAEVSMSVAGILRQREWLRAGEHQLIVDPWLPDGDHDVQIITKGLLRGRQSAVRRVRVVSEDSLSPDMPPAANPQDRLAGARIHRADQLARHSMPRLVQVSAPVPMQEILLQTELDATQLQLARNGNGLHLTVTGSARPDSALTLALRAQYRGQALAFQIGGVPLLPADDLTADPALYRYLRQINETDAAVAGGDAHISFPLRLAASGNADDTAIATPASRANNLQQLRDWSQARGIEQAALSARWTDSEAGAVSRLLIDAAPRRSTDLIQLADRGTLQHDMTSADEFAGRDHVGYAGYVAHADHHAGDAEHAGYAAILTEHRDDWPGARRARELDDGDATAYVSDVASSRVATVDWRCEPAPMLSLGSRSPIDLCLDRDDDDELPMTLATAARALRSDVVRDQSGIDVRLS